MNRPRLITMLTVLGIGAFVLSLLTGPARIGPVASIEALLAGGNEAAMIIMREIRLPRSPQRSREVGSIGRSSSSR